ncbi:MAG: anion permease, partial [Desulfobacterales bacterium]
MAHHPEVDRNPKSSIWANKPGYKPVLFLIAGIVFAGLVVLPPPQSMVDMASKLDPPGYMLAPGCRTITDNINKKLHPNAFEVETIAHSKEHAKAEPLLTPRQAAQMAKVMLAIFFLAVFLWGTESLPLGATDILAGVMLYLFSVLPINEISQAYMTDAVFFIFGILAVAVGVTKTGLDKRIGLILLSRIKNAWAFAFVFLPLLALSAGFLSAHALVALLIPVLMGVYKVTCKIYGIEKDRVLAVFLLLGICFAANHGGPGSPVAGGRNAIMVGYLTEYGAAITFLDWMK